MILTSSSSLRCIESLRSRQFLNTCRQFYRFNATSAEAPLRIAFFGSDAFSVQSLDKLYNYKLQNPHKIEAIDVITRSIKPTGRKLKTLVDLPIGDYCYRLNEAACEERLPVIRADSSQEILDILQTRHYSMAIAVSYGKLIPAEFIKSCVHGGLNVHPSLLPKYSGSSPIQFALMNDDSTTGCTIQTLHPTKFDRGEIILQSGEIAIGENSNFSTLQAELASIGSELLVTTIDKELYKSGIERGIMKTYPFSLAPKISPKKSEIVWGSLTSKQIKRLEDALGPLYSYKFVNVIKKKKIIKEYQRVIISGITILERDHFQGYNDLRRVGEFMLENSATPRLIIKTRDGFIGASSLKFQACNEETPTEFVKALIKRSGETANKFVNI
ncbi:methionyl-tRNA transformylase [Scheffersomyces xylosifermentans]|uniref:methionyl-tRNA transformylase n=1 Tax=Scheffersomyces xylosifermentans TaxID=1304137 RepID=UPI00315CFC76